MDRFNYNFSYSLFTNLRMTLMTLVVFSFISSSSFAQDCPHGKIILRSQEQIDNFKIKYPDCTQIKGELRIIASDATNLNGLNQITELLGGLTIRSCDLLKNLKGFDQLKKVLSIDIANNESLENFMGFEKLEEIYSPYLSRLFISHCPKLNSLEGLERLKKLNSIRVAHCPAIESLESLNNVEHLKGINVEHCNSLKTLPTLTKDYLASLTIIHCENITNLAGLESIRKIHSLNFMYLASIKNFEGLNQLEEVEDILSLQYTSMNSLNGLSSLKQVGGSLLISCNPYLQDISGLENIHTVGRGFLFSKNSNVHDLSSIKSLKSVEELTITSNKSLKSLGTLTKEIVKGSNVFKVKDNHPSLQVPN